MGALGTQHFPVRWRDDTGWEAKCQSCGDWWPLADEFWRKRAMSRCRACWLEYQKQYQNEKYASDPEFREDKKAAARLSAWKDRKLRPLEVSDRKRRYYVTNRESILEKRRAAYWRDKEKAA